MPDFWVSIYRRQRKVIFISQLPSDKQPKKGQDRERWEAPRQIRQCTSRPENPALLFQGTRRTTFPLSQVPAQPLGEYSLLGNQGTSTCQDSARCFKRKQKEVHLLAKPNSAEKIVPFRFPSTTLPVYRKKNHLSYCNIFVYMSIFLLDCNPIESQRLMKHTGRFKLAGRNHFCLICKVMCLISLAKNARSGGASTQSRSRWSCF